MPSIHDILKSPASFTEDQALDAASEEASIAAAELVGPNSVEYERIREQKEEEFMQRYHDARDGAGTVPSLRQGG